MMDDMFGRYPAKMEIAPGAFLLTSFISDEDALLEALATVESAAPFRHMETARGFRMSVAMTNCGLGWVSDRRGYRYDARDPLTGKPWPAMPPAFASLAASAAAAAGYPGFMPDGALINRYEVGAKLSLHQDKDEADLAAPIVSVSLGIPALFLFGGLDREAPKKKNRTASWRRCGLGRPLPPRLSRDPTVKRSKPSAAGAATHQSHFPESKIILKVRAQKPALPR